MSRANTRTKINVREPGAVRITVSIPAVVNMFLKKRVPKRQISQFVADAIARQIPIYVAKNSNSRSYLRELLEYREKVKHPMTTKQIIAAINKGRL